jgi:hypothetical protein
MDFDLEIFMIYYSNLIGTVGVHSERVSSSGLLFVPMKSGYSEFSKGMESVMKNKPIITQIYRPLGGQNERGRKQPFRAHRRQDIETNRR